MKLTSVLASKILEVSKTGTPIRHARGVVVSSNIGQTVVTIDGGSTSITAFNYSHSQGFPTGAVVDLLLVGRKAYVIGSYDNDVPVGGLAAHTYGPATSTSFASLSSATGASVPVVAGHVYELHGRVLGTQQTSAGLVEAQLTTGDGLVSGVRFVSTSLSAGVEFAGGGSTIWSPTTTASTSASLNLFDSAGSFLVGSGAAELIVKRVA